MILIKHPMALNGDTMSKCTIYTDGAYSSSRDQGGWAFVVLKDDMKIHSSFFSEEVTTNNRMEIRAVMEACKWAKVNGYNEITIISDSMYVIGTMTKSWKRKKNVDLWEEFDKIIKGMTIDFQHVKGHNGDKYNDLCDALAVEASHCTIKF